MDSCIVQPPKSLDKDEIERILSSVSKYKNSELHKKFRWFLYDMENNAQLFYEERNDDVQHVYTSKNIPKNELCLDRKKTIYYKKRKFEQTELTMTQLRIPEERIIATYKQSSQANSRINYLKQEFEIESGNLKNTSVIHAHKKLDFNSNVLYELYRKKP